MGLVYADIELVNQRDIFAFDLGVIKKENIRRKTYRMNVNSGAIMLAINESIMVEMGLKETSRRTVLLADGSVVEMAVVGPIEVHFANRDSSVNALVLPGDAEPLFGAIPMEEMDLIVDPAKNALTVHPLRPDRPVMALR